MKTDKILKSSKSFFARHWKKWTILAFLAILVYIGFVFYKYVYGPLYSQREVSPFKLEIKKATYQSIKDNYSGREEKINQIINKNYSDPFK